ncbi:MAG: EAL domain-containing protein, partial [Acidobacteriota bacterium]|nr:EAL domain-containing protein [Acidobacteriota bacterium]
PAIAAQLGYAADELIGRNMRELLAPSVQQLFGEYLARCRNEEAHGGVMRVVTRAGEERVWAYHNTRRETPGGGGLDASYVLGHAHDITERKQAEDEIKRANEELERRVAERTAEMRATNWQLQKELLIRQRAEEALRHSEERYRDLFENANDVHYTHDLRGNFTSVNKAGETIIGYTRDELLEMNVSHLVASDYLELARRMLADKLAGAGTDVYEIEIITKNGRKVMLEFGIRLLLEAGQPVGVQGIARDITERKRVREALRESEERYALAALGANDGLWDWNLKHRHIYFSARWKSMLGYADAEIGTCPEEWFDRIHPEDASKVEREINAHLEGGDGHFESEYRMRHKDGSYLWVLSRGIAAVRDAAGQATRIAGSQTDITQRKQVEEQLTHDAFHDVLTGLPNRALFTEHLNLVVEQLTRRPASLFAVLFLDLDQFKLINDSLGHAAGDQLLVEISRRLKHCLRPGDTVARLGGDEFTILLHDMKDATDAYYVAERIHDGLTLPLDIDGHEVYTTVSIGIALSSTGFDRPADLLRAADTALYRAKALGRARHEVFDQDMHSRVKTLLQLETDLRRAVERRELRVHYQPIIALDTERVTGFEALVRWQHPERGLVYPASFIPAAEETGLIIPIGRWVLEEACRQARAWQERFRPSPPLSLSVNLSGKQFAQPDLLDTIECILSATGFDAGCLKLEITESVVMENAESTAAMLLRLRAIGVQLNIDDFGTGYSSLSYLQRFPISTLKVDRSFVSRMGGRDEDSKIVRAIIMLAHTLGMDVIAEGVETTAQLAELKSLNCGYAQGNLFSRALSVAEVEELLSLVAATTSAARTIRIDFGQVELT